MNKDSKIPLALWVTMVGLALFMVFTFIGGFLKTGDYAMNIIYAVGKTAVLALLIWFMTYAKGKEDHIELWKKVEIATVVVFVVVAVLFATPLLRFFSVNAEKEKIQNYAMADVKNIRDVIDTFKDAEMNRISNTTVGMKNCLGSSVQRTVQLQEFLDEEGVKNNGTVELWSEDRTNDLNTLCDRLNDSLDRCCNAVSNWQLFELPFSADTLSRLAQQVPVSLQRFDSINHFPSINIDQGKYTMSNSPVAVGAIPELQYPSLLTQKPAISVINVLLVILLNLVILFRYLLAYRSRKVQMGHIEQNGGHPIG